MGMREGDPVSVAFDEPTAEELERTAADLFDPIELSRRTVSGVGRLARTWWVLRQQDRAERRRLRLLFEQATAGRTTAPDAAEPTVPLQAVPEGSDAWREGRYRFKQQNARYPYWVERVDR